LLYVLRGSLQALLRLALLLLEVRQALGVPAHHQTSQRSAFRVQQMKLGSAPLA
jgi:hypothetical protein